jgi:hypothetical protein
MAAAKAEVRARSRGRCEAMIAPDCVGRGQHLHHVVRRSQGGADDASNLLDLCAADHSLIHANPDWSKRHGFITSNCDVPMTPIRGCSLTCNVDHRADIPL